MKAADIEVGRYYRSANIGHPTMLAEEWAGDRVKARFINGKTERVTVNRIERLATVGEIADFHRDAEGYTLCTKLLEILKRHGITSYHPTPTGAEVRLSNHQMRILINALAAEAEG